MYKFYQPNELDEKRKKGDCVVRALCKVTGLTWREVFLRLCGYALESQDMPNSKETFEEFLKYECGAKFTGIKVTKGSKRPTVYSFAQEHPEGTYILKVAHHVVACVDGNYYDKWDCGMKPMYGFYKIK